MSKYPEDQARFYIKNLLGGRALEGDEVWMQGKWWGVQSDEDGNIVFIHGYGTARPETIIVELKLKKVVE